MVTPWQLVISKLDGARPDRETTVEAGNWLAALRKARKALGEEGGVPEGASCSMAQNGDVTIVDPVSGQRYALRRPSGDVARVTPEATGKAAVGGKTAAYGPEEAAQIRAALKAARPPEAVPPAEAAPLGEPAAPSPAVRPPESAPPKRRAQSLPPLSPELALGTRPATPEATTETDPTASPRAARQSFSSPGPPKQPSARGLPKVATPISEARRTREATPEAPAKPAAQGHTTLDVRSQLADDPPRGTSEPRPPKARSATLAYRENPLGGPRAVPSAPEPASTTPASDATPAAPVPPEPDPSPSHERPASTSVVLLSSRNLDPGPVGPLTYRERAFAIDPQTDEIGCEWILLQQLALLRQDLEGRDEGVFVSLALFDHAWKQRPSAPPVATLRWKDWRGEPVIQFSGSGVWLTSGAAARGEPTPTRPSRLAEVHRTGEHDRRLASAFESVQDLYFLQTPGDGVAFVTRLLQELVPCAAARGTLYDINADALRPIGHAGEDDDVPGERAGLAAHEGLFGVAIESGLPVWTCETVADDARYAREVDGIPGHAETPRNAAYVVLRHRETLLGVVQLVDRNRGKSFSQEDKAVITYVAEQLCSFLMELRRGTR